MGLTAHWIEVVKTKIGKEEMQKWKMRGAVVGFKPVIGDHSRKNLGRHLVGMCKHVGILNKDTSKVRTSLGI